MYLILLALGAGALAYLLAGLAAGWVAGIVPGLLAAAGVAFFLYQRNSRRAQAVMLGVQAALARQDIEGAKAQLLGLLTLERWQPLLKEQVYGQLGQIDYMIALQQRMQGQNDAARLGFASAKENLEKSWNRDWRARATLAFVHFREGHPEEGAKVLKGAASTVSNEPLFWAVYAWMLNEARQPAEALLQVAEGLKHSKDSPGLKAMQDALANKRRPDMSVFGEGWFAFIPVDTQVEGLIREVQVAMERQDVKRARFLLESAVASDGVHPGMKGQLYSQLGQLDYMEGASLKMQRQDGSARQRFEEARKNLEKGVDQDWRGRAVLALCHQRAGRTDEALTVLTGAEPYGETEALYWAVRLWVLTQAQRKDEAKAVVERAVKVALDTEGLFKLRVALQQRQKPDMTVFGEGWYNFVPEDIPREVLMKMAANAGHPVPTERPQKGPPPQKGWPGRPR